MAGHEDPWPLIGQMPGDGGLWLADMGWLLLCPGDSCQPHYPGLWSHHHYHYHDENHRTRRVTHPKQSQYCQFVWATHIFHCRVEKSVNQGNKCKQSNRRTHGQSPLSLQMLSGGWTGHRVTAAKHIVMSQPAITRGEEEELHMGLGKWNQNGSCKWDTKSLTSNLMPTI